MASVLLLAFSREQEQNEAFAIFCPSIILFIEDVWSFLETDLCLSWLCKVQQNYEFWAGLCLLPVTPALKRCLHKWIPVFTVQGKTVDHVWMRGLLMSSWWIEWPMVAVRLWYRYPAQVHFIDGTLKHSNTMTRSWGQNYYLILQQRWIFSSDPQQRCREITIFWKVRSNPDSLDTISHFGIT